MCGSCLYPRDVWRFQARLWQRAGWDIIVSYVDLDEGNNQVGNYCSDTKEERWQTVSRRGRSRKYQLTSL